MNLKSDGKPSAAVLVVSERRTGSNLLSDMIEQHDAVQPLGELLRPVDYPELAGKSSLERSLLLKGWLEADPPACGKLMFHQMAGHDVSLFNVVDQLAETPKIIVLFRRSLIDQFLSLRTAEQSDRWVFDTYDGVPPLDIDLKDFWEFCELSKKRYGVLLEELDRQQLPYALVSYEELDEKLSDVVDLLILDWIGLPPWPQQIRLNKQETRAATERARDAELVARLRSDPRARHSFQTSLEGHTALNRRATTTNVVTKAPRESL